MRSPVVMITFTTMSKLFIMNPVHFPVFSVSLSFSELHLVIMGLCISYMPVFLDHLHTVLS